MGTSLPPTVSIGASLVCKSWWLAACRSSRRPGRAVVKPSRHLHNSMRPSTTQVAAERGGKDKQTEDERIPQGCAELRTCCAALSLRTLRYHPRLWTKFRV